MLRIISCFLALSLLVCSKRRDEALLVLYRDGIQYLESTRNALSCVTTAEAAAEVAENALPPLKRLVERKKQLEQLYPELADTQNREKIHRAFPEFHQLRAAARALYIEGDVLANKYKNHARFRKAIRDGWEMLAYF